MKLSKIVKSFAIISLVSKPDENQSAVMITTVYLLGIPVFKMRNFT